MEIGSFIEIYLKNTGEYFKDEINTARLNSGRSGILHALLILKCTIIYLPYYLCPDVKLFLESKSILIKYYNITEEFEPIMERNENDSAFLIVNYFGILSEMKLLSIIQRYNNVILDNCAAFFMRSLPGCLNIYSCRKFFGVPDGCYVVGSDAGSNVYNYFQDQSSNTSAFLLMRIENGCSATYQERMKNEERINNSDILRMSKLTKSLMGSLDYEFFRRKRIENYRYTCTLYEPINRIKPNHLSDDESAPMFYPLVVMDEKLVEKLQSYGIYTGRRWNNVLKEVNANTFEAFLSSYMVPLPLDHRYGEKELNYCFDIFNKVVRL